MTTPPGEPASNLRVSIQRTLGDTTNYDTVIGNTAVTDAQWVNLAGSYTLSNNVDALSLYVESSTGTASFYIDDFRLSYVPALPIQSDIPRVFEVLDGKYAALKEKLNGGAETPAAGETETEEEAATAVGAAGASEPF